VSIAASLALYSLAVMTLGPPFLRRLPEGHAPRFAIAAWLTAVVSMLLCWAVVAALIAVEFAGHTAGPDSVLASCVDRLRATLLGAAGWPLQVITWLILTAMVVSASAIAVRVIVSLGRMRGHAHDHARAVRIAGRPAGGQVVIVEAAEPAAYCVVGRPSAIVVTTAAVDTLDSFELAAVVAHERAHLAGRHALLVALLRSLAAALPGVGLFTAAAARVAALLEMCADDAASRHHGAAPLLGGLLAMSGATPSPALGAADLEVLARAERLLRTAPQRCRLRARALLSAAMTVIAAGPVGIAALTVTGVLLCTA